jgi:hypothetical protein
MPVDVRVRDRAPRAVRGRGLPPDHRRASDSSVPGCSRSPEERANPPERNRQAGAAPYGRERRGAARPGSRSIEARGGGAGRRAGAEGGRACPGSPRRATAASSVGTRAPSGRSWSGAAPATTCQGDRVAGQGHAPCAGALQGAVHGVERARRKDRASPGAPPSPDPERGPGGHHRPRADRAHRGARARQVRRDRVAAPVARPDVPSAVLAARPGSCSTGGLAAGWSPVHVRGRRGAALPRDRGPRVSPRGTVCARWGSRRGKRAAPLPQPQRLPAEHDFGTAYLRVRPEGAAIRR